MFNCCLNHSVTRLTVSASKARLASRTRLEILLWLLGNSDEVVDLLLLSLEALVRLVCVGLGLPVVLVRSLAVLLVSLLLLAILQFRHHLVSGC